jgi:hypothetical protein
MFEVGRLVPSNINVARWHVGHIFDAKDRNVDWESWDRAELARRFIRNIHPCNCFYIPHVGWQRYGGDPRVIGFFADQYRQRYAAIWDEFVHHSADTHPLGGDASMRYEYAVAPAKTEADRSPGVVMSYPYSRLCFKADLIERLRDDDVFEVVTPEGRFRMTKREFYRDFPNVVASNSYRVRRIYHYPNTPAAARRYRVTEE